jgi:hypothetical protein
MHTVLNELISEWDEIESIEFAGFEETMDVNLSGNRLFWANGILTHNCATDAVEFDHSHISGGISKIQTADNVIGIFRNQSMRDSGRVQIQFMKTRNSSGVGQKVELSMDINSLRISDISDDDAKIMPTTTDMMFNDLRRRSTQGSPNTQPSVRSSDDAPKAKEGWSLEKPNVNESVMDRVGQMRNLLRKS